MRTPKQIEASRANGRKSNGPKTPEGKQISARNSMRHGLLAQAVLIEGEDSANLDALFNHYLARFDPVDDFEIGLIEEMTAAFWRGRRVMAVETRLLETAMEAQPHDDPIDRLAAGFSALAATPDFNNIGRYEARYHRMFQRALRNLLILRKQNSPNEPKPPSLPDLPNEPETTLTPTPAAPPAPTPPPQPPPSDPPATLVPQAKPKTERRRWRTAGRGLKRIKYRRGLPVNTGGHDVRVASSSHTGKVLKTA